MAKTILLADDSVTIQKVVELTFMDEDYSVVAVSDGAAALEQLPEVGPDLVIADVHMPGADGYEVCRRTKERHPSIPVLLLVGTFEQFDEEQARAAGADGHLKKPFDSQELLSQVERLVSGAGPTAAASPADELPTTEIPLADFPPLEAADEEDLFAAGGPPVAEPPPSADLEPPPSGEVSDTAAIEAPTFDEAGDVFELAEDEPSAVEEPAEAGALREGEPASEPAVALETESRGAASDLEAPAYDEALPAAAEPVAAEPAAAEPAAANGALSDGDVERIARRVAEMVGEKMLREVAWEVVPDLAEVIVKERIRELESQVE